MATDKDPKIKEQEVPLKEAFKKAIGSINIIGKATSDDLKLFVDIVLPKEEVPEPLLDISDLTRVLTETAYPKFLHRDVLLDVVTTINSGKSVLNRRVSKGEPAIAGKDGKIVYLVKKLGGKGEVKVDDKGIADFSMLNLFDNIETGMNVARIYEPKAGFAGKDVFGKDIPAPLGNVVQYKLDGTINEVSDESNTSYKSLVAKSNGYLFEENGLITVRDELVIAGDLDYHFGVIDFIGKVKIAGDVMPGFSINAREGIEIKGSSRGGSLISTHGPIVVDGFVYGGKNSRVISGVSFTARIVQEINAEIRGDITIIVESRDSRLRSESTLKMEKGLLYGGKCSVVCGAECHIMGSDVHTPTQIDFVGNDETTVAFSELGVRIKNHIKAIEMLRLHLGPFADDRKQVESLKRDHKLKVLDLISKLEKLENGRDELLVKQFAISESSRKTTVNRVNILGKMYPGSMISVGERIFSPDQVLSGPVSIEYDFATGEFKTGEVKGIECQYEEVSGEVPGELPTGEVPEVKVSATEPVTEAPAVLANKEEKVVKNEPDSDKADIDKKAE